MSVPAEVHGALGLAQGAVDGIKASFRREFVGVVVWVIHWLPPSGVGDIGLVLYYKVVCITNHRAHSFAVLQSHSFCVDAMFEEAGLIRRASNDWTVQSGTLTALFSALDSD